MAHTYVLDTISVYKIKYKQQLKKHHPTKPKIARWNYTTAYCSDTIL